MPGSFFVADSFDTIKGLGGKRLRQICRTYAETVFYPGRKCRAVFPEIRRGGGLCRSAERPEEPQIGFAAARFQ